MTPAESVSSLHSRMTKVTSMVCLDVGEKRIGVAVGNSTVRIAVPYETIEVDGNEAMAIVDIINNTGADILVVGYPRNQSGELTAQTKFVTDFVAKLGNVAPKIEFQDESLTSVIAEQRLISYHKPYKKGDIDAQAAAIILQDYLETKYA